MQALGFESDRLKTGTPARVDRRTIDFSVLEEQPGEEEHRWFSHDPAVHIPREQMACHMTRTTAATHELIRANLHETPTYGGWVEARGPRYCPSIEDKIVRFADKDSHQIFLEPEGARSFSSSGWDENGLLELKLTRRRCLLPPAPSLASQGAAKLPLGCADAHDVGTAGRDTPEIYVQGFSTGLPERLQLHMLRTLPGLESCKMLRPAYAVEYDFFPAMQCDRSLQTRTISGLFFSGQLNGTTGYEEAAAQVSCGTALFGPLPAHGWRVNSGPSFNRGRVC